MTRRDATNLQHLTSNILPLAASALLFITAGVYFAGLSGSDPNVYRNDFNVYYFAAREVIGGRAPYQNSLGAWTPYLYPPLLAELLTPLAFLPLPIAAFIWFAINAAALCVALWMAAKMALDEDRASRRAAYFVIAATAAVLARFILDNFAYGQVNLLVVALAVAHIFFFEKRPKMAAFLLALAASIKLTPLLFIVLHLARKRFEVAIWIVVFFAALTAASLLPFGKQAPDIARNVISRTVRNGQGFDLADPGNQSLRGAVARALRESGESARITSNPVTRIMSFLLVALACLFVWRMPAARAAAPFFCLLVILSPLSWKAHFVALILPIACIAAGAFRRGSFHISMAALLLIIAAIFNLTSPRLIGEWGAAADRASLVLAGAMLLFAATLSLNWQAARRFVNLPFPHQGEMQFHDDERARRTED